MLLKNAHTKRGMIETTEKGIKRLPMECPTFQSASRGCASHHSKCMILVFSPENLKLGRTTGFNGGSSKASIILR